MKIFNPLGAKDESDSVKGLNVDYAGTMGSATKALNPFSTNAESIAAITAAQNWLIKNGDSDSKKYSRFLSKLLGMPIIVRNLADIKHAFLHPDCTTEFTARQINERTADWRKATYLALPNTQNIWKQLNWQWRATAKMFMASMDFVCRIPEFTNTNLPKLLDGAFETILAIITLTDRRWTTEECWQDDKALGCRSLEKHPTGIGHKIYTIGHELAHVFQRKYSNNKVQAKALRWVREINADANSFGGMDVIANDPRSAPEIRQELRDAKTAVIHSRALGGFRSMAPVYWSALAFDKVDQENITYEKSLLIGYELRYRSLEAQKGEAVFESSTAIQNRVSNWQTNLVMDKIQTALDTYQNFVQWTHILDALAEWNAHPLLQELESIVKSDRKNDRQLIQDVVTLWKSNPANTKEDFSYLDALKIEGVRTEWHLHNDTDYAVKALSSVIKEIDDPLAKRTAELVIDGASYFYPSLENEIRNASRLAPAVPANDVDAFPTKINKLAYA